MSIGRLYGGRPLTSTLAATCPPTQIDVIVFYYYLIKIKGGQQFAAMWHNQHYESSIYGQPEKYCYVLYIRKY